MKYWVLACAMVLGLLVAAGAVLILGCAGAEETRCSALPLGEGLAVGAAAVLALAVSGGIIRAVRKTRKHATPHRTHERR